MNRIIKQNHIQAFESHLRTDEKSANTIAKYIRDVRKFTVFANGRKVNKELTLNYKAFLGEKHAVTGANSILAAMNSFLRYMGWQDACVKQYKVQQKAYCPEEKELTKAEYVRLVNTAMDNGNERLSLILQTICGTGIRVSELQYITVEAARNGQAIVRCKGKMRVVFIVSELRQLLLQYVRCKGITKGAVFVTQNGTPIGRSNIWKEMKKLCKKAKVASEKVFPHNLRHLFAHTFYSMEKDIAKLADVLGHTSINTTRIYLMTTGAEHRRKLENMQLVLGNKPHQKKIAENSTIQLHNSHYVRIHPNSTL